MDFGFMSSEECPKNRVLADLPPRAVLLKGEESNRIKKIETTKIKKKQFTQRKRIVFFVEGRRENWPQPISEVLPENPGIAETKLFKRWKKQVRRDAPRNTPY